MNNRLCRIFLFLSLAACLFLNLGTIRRKEDQDPILKTQTGPITLDAKKEEMKDGEKGAPMPTWRMYPRWRFLVDLPMRSNRSATASAQTNQAQGAQEIEPGDFGEVGDQAAQPAAKIGEEEPIRYDELKDQWWSEIVVENPFKEKPKTDEAQGKDFAKAENLSGESPETSGS